MPTPPPPGTPADEWAKRFDELMAGQQAPAGAPQGAHAFAVLPTPVSVSDVANTYMLAMNYLATAMQTGGLSGEGAGKMARCALDAIRLAAGVEAALTMHSQMHK
ncbi:MAG TPA: hypothetical protein VFW98_08250 [Gemmatimonadaceae bacterium]|nr:hypothetical protein [Gemmatimonadaceae bacterium]